MKVQNKLRFSHGAKMSNENTIADHWGKDDVYSVIIMALEKTYKSLDNLTVNVLAPIDHYHA